MKPFDVSISERVSYSLRVEAGSAQEAEKLARDQFFQMPEAERALICDGCEDLEVSAAEVKESGE